MKKSALIGLSVGLFLSCMLAFFFGENPLKVLKILTLGFATSRYEMGLTLYYTTCFIFSGLAFSIPLRAGLFHIGAEGQILFSGFVAGAFSMTYPTSSLFLVFFMTLLSSVVWATVIAFFKIFRQAHEVVVAIMLNYILSILTTYLTVQYFQNPNSQNPETALLSSSLELVSIDPLKKYFEGSPVSVFFIVAILTALTVYIFEKYTVKGLQLKAFGANPIAGRRIGLSDLKMYSFVMIAAGVMTGLIGLTEVFGNANQFKVGFSPQIGFIGIAVSILARQNPLGIIASAFLFACLHKGASDLDIESEFLTRDFSKVVQALIIFSVASAFFLAPQVENYFRNRKTIKSNPSEAAK